MAGNRSDRRWRNRALVRERDVQRARGLWAALLMFGAALVPAGVYLYEQNTCLQLSYEIESIERQREDLDELERRLEVRQAAVASMHSIERWAARKRLERPEATEIVIVPFEDAGGDTMLARVPEGTSGSASPRPRRFE